MPKIAKSLTELQFAAALKKMGATENPKQFLCGRTFTIRVSKTFSITDARAVYVGFGLKAQIDLDATLKSLKAEKSYARPPRKARAPKPQTLFDPSKGLAAQGKSDPEPVVTQAAT